MWDAAAQERYGRWKSFIPVLYDNFVNHSLVWPSLSCRWGPQLEQDPHFRQVVYYTEQTYGKYPNSLVVANCELSKSRVADPEALSDFNEKSKASTVKKIKCIHHPGEVNRIRELPQNSKIVATHTDKPEVYVWNLSTQPNKAGKAPSVPDLVLTGHTENAPFALALSPAAPSVLSGGDDHAVVLWDIEEPLAAVGGKSVPALCKFEGHEKSVEDVQFKPSSFKEFCSVGDDSALILWDARSGHKPAAKVANAHDGDVHCVDWNAQDENYILSGSLDRSAKVFDQRKLATNGEVEKFEGHTSPVLCVQWSPAKPYVFGTSSEDGLVNIWDMKEGMLFQHAGHRGKVLEFHWNALDPWQILSIAQDWNGGGTLQMWRMNDMIYRDKEEVVAEMLLAKNSLMNLSS